MNHVPADLSAAGEIARRRREEEDPAAASALRHALPRQRAGAGISRVGEVAEVAVPAISPAAGIAAAVVAMESGWIVTEVGRQPWVVYRLLTTAQAATTNGGVIDTLTAVIVLYALLGVGTVLILRLLARRWRQGDQGAVAVPYGPPDARSTVEAR